MYISAVRMLIGFAVMQCLQRQAYGACFDGQKQGLVGLLASSRLLFVKGQDTSNANASFEAMRNFAAQSSHNHGEYLRLADSSILHVKKKDGHVVYNVKSMSKNDLGAALRKNSVRHNRTASSMLLIENFLFSPEYLDPGHNLWTHSLACNVLRSEPEKRVLGMRAVQCMALRSLISYIKTDLLSILSHNQEALDANANRIQTLHNEVDMLYERVSISTIEQVIQGISSDRRVILNIAADLYFKKKYKMLSNNTKTALKNQLVSKYPYPYQAITTLPSQLADLLYPSHLLHEIKRKEMATRNGSISQVFTVRAEDLNILYKLLGLKYLMNKDYSQEKEDYRVSVSSNLSEKEWDKVYFNTENMQEQIDSAALEWHLNTYIPLMSQTIANRPELKMPNNKYLTMDASVVPFQRSLLNQLLKCNIEITQSHNMWAKTLCEYLCSQVYTYVCAPEVKCIPVVQEILVVDHNKVVLFQPGHLEQVAILLCSSRSTGRSAEDIHNYRKIWLKYLTNNISSQKTYDLFHNVQSIAKEMQSMFNPEKKTTNSNSEFQNESDSPTLDVANEIDDMQGRASPQPSIPGSENTTRTRGTSIYHNGEEGPSGGDRGSNLDYETSPNSDMPTLYGLASNLIALFGVFGYDEETAGKAFEDANLKINSTVVVFLDKLSKLNLEMHENSEIEYDPETTKLSKKQAQLVLNAFLEALDIVLKSKMPYTDVHRYTQTSAAKGVLNRAKMQTDKAFEEILEYLRSSSHSIFQTNIHTLLTPPEKRAEPSALNTQKFMHFQNTSIIGEPSDKEAVKRKMPKKEVVIMDLKANKKLAEKEYYSPYVLSNACGCVMFFEKPETYGIFSAVLDSQLNLGSTLYLYEKNHVGGPMPPHE